MSRREKADRRKQNAIADDSVPSFLFSAERKRIRACSRLISNNCTRSALEIGDRSVKLRWSLEARDRF